jgi:outer membrane lipase/esterase
MRLAKLGFIVTAMAVLCADIAEAQTFGSVYGFGDSLTDNARIFRLLPLDPAATAQNFPLFAGGNGRNSNGLLWIETLPGKIGANFATDNDYAIGGAVSGRIPGLNTGSLASLSLGGVFLPGLTDQVSEFIAGVGHFKPNDVVAVWIGTNDFSLQPITGQSAAQITTQLNTNVVSNIQRLAAVGGRNFVVLNINDSPDAGGLVDARAAYDRNLPALLAPLSASGLNIHLFDVASFLERLRANPTAFGFAPDAGTPCINVPACTGANINRYITFEGTHLTATVNDYISSFVANQLNAPFTIPVQADMAQSTAIAFTGSLQGRLDAYRYSNAAASPSNAYAMYTKAPPSQSPDAYGPWSIFAMGTYVHANQRDELGVAGYDIDPGAGTVGFDYRWSRNLLLGSAFSYSDATVNQSLDNAQTRLKSYQFAGFASLTYANWFADVVVSYGINNYNISRASAGLGSTSSVLTAVPDGNSFVAASRAGYLFDTNVVRVGPTVGLTYSRVWIDSYTESGDPLLIQAVAKQNLDGWTASAGIQFRLPTTSGPQRFNPFFNLTAEHDFGGNARVITKLTRLASLLLRQSAAVIPRRTAKPPEEPLSI